MGSQKFIKKLEEFKKNIKIGDKFCLTQDDIAFEHDYDLPHTMTFYVVKKYEHVVLLEKPCKYGIHRQSMSYLNLFMLTHRSENVW